MVVAVDRDFVHAFAEDGGIGQAVAGDEDVLVVFGVGARHVRGAHEEFAQENHGQNDAHDTQRVGHGAAQRGAVGVHPHLLQGLLCGTQRRGVGRRAAEDARHVGHRDLEGVAQPHGQRRAEQYDGDGRRHQPQPIDAHRAEKARSHLQTEGVDEDHQSETFGVGQHRRVERQPEVSGHDPHEEDESRAERDSEEADLAQSDADRRDERDHHDGLQCRVLDEQFFKPFHPVVVENAAKVGQIFGIAAFLPDEKHSEYGRRHRFVCYIATIRPGVNTETPSRL